jgi:acyl-CoA hydrolase
VRNAKTVIAQVNPQMPRTLGDTMVHLDNVDYAVKVNEPLPEVDYKTKVNAQIATIGRLCAALIEDRSTLQMGIGAIPDAVLSSLNNHKDLGIHSEMISDGIIPLAERGVITNKYKHKHRGRIVAGFALGTRKLYDFLDDNPFVTFLDIAYVNDAGVIRQNPKVVAINSALEVDLTGQVCADTIGECQYSGVGGQMDFIRGASLSEGGKPVIAMMSVTASGKAKIVPRLSPGSAVVTTRAHVHYVVTEYGTAFLFGKNLRQRAVALMNIAHPDHRESLDREIFRLYGKTIR